MSEDKNYHQLRERTTKVLTCSVNDCILLIVQHQLTLDKYTETYVVKHDKFLGRFKHQETPAFEAEWEAAEHSSPASDSDILEFKKTRIALFGSVSKIWK